MTFENRDTHARFKQAGIESANRAEATALLIRCGFRVYRPEADVEGEDLVIRPPGGALAGVQLKSRPWVDWRRYGGRGLLMLFPVGPFAPDAPRPWFLIPHDTLFSDWMKPRHGHTPKWADQWSYPHVGRELSAFLASYQVRPPAETDIPGDDESHSN